MADREAAKKAARLKNIDTAMAALNKKFGTGTIMKLGDNTHANVEFISTGSLVMDHILGGGLAKGRIVEFFGPESSGKTTAALVAAGNVQRSGGNVAFIDVEHALDPRQARRLGVDTDSLFFSQPDYAEQALEIMNTLADSGAFDLIILDSTAALAPKAEVEGTMEDQQVGLVARIMGKGLRKLVATAANSGTTCIFINQVRDKVGVFFGSPETTPGGRALKFAASQRMRISRIKSIKDGDKVIANQVKVQCVKNKVAAPFGQGETVINFVKGIDTEAEVETIAESLGLFRKGNKEVNPDERANGWYDSATGELLAPNRKALEVMFQEDHDFLLSWKDKCTKKLASMNSEELGDEPTDEEAKEGEDPKTENGITFDDEV